MATILDALKQQQNQPTQLAGKAAQGSTQKLQQVVAQLSGKASAQQATAAAPQQNLIEQRAIGDVQSAAQTQQGTAAVQQAQMAEQGQAQQSQASQQHAALEEKAQAIADSASNKTSQLLQEAEQNRGTLNLAKNKAKAQQLGFNMRLANDKYVKRLAQEGQLRRLGDKISFEEQTVKSLFSKEQDLFKDQLDFNEALTMDELSWWEELQNVELDNWLAEAKMIGAQQSAQQMASGAGSVVSAATSYYAEKEKEGK